MSEGWVKLHRSTLESSVFMKPNIFIVWCLILMRAGYKKTKFPFNGEDLTLLPGEFISSHDSLLEDLPPTFSIQKIRTALDYLKSTDRITVKSTNKFSIISVTNWEDYQSDNRPDNNQITNEQQASNKPVTTNKNDQELKNIDPPLTPPSGGSRKRRGETKYHDFSESDFTWPAKWGPQAKLAVKDWVEFKSKAGHAILKMSYQTQIDQFADNPRHFDRLVRRAINKPWRGLNEQIPFEDQKPNTPFQKEDPNANRPRPADYVPPAPLPPETPEQRAKVKALLAETLTKLGAKRPTTASEHDSGSNPPDTINQPPIASLAKD